MVDTLARARAWSRKLWLRVGLAFTINLFSFFMTDRKDIISFSFFNIHYTPLDDGFRC